MKTPSKSIVPAKPSLVSRLKLNWNPKPIAQPRIDPAFHQLDHLQRTTEVLHFTACKLEWWMSPNGMLREWLRFNLVITVVLGIPALLIVPLITYLLCQFATWADLFTRIGSNLVVFPVTILIGIALLSAVVLLIQRLLRR